MCLIEIFQSSNIEQVQPMKLLVGISNNLPMLFKHPNSSSWPLILDPHMLTLIDQFKPAWLYSKDSDKVAKSTDLFCRFQNWKQLPEEKEMSNKFYLNSTLSVWLNLHTTSLQIFLLLSK